MPEERGNIQSARGKRSAGNERRVRRTRRRAERFPLSERRARRESAAERRSASAGRQNGAQEQRGARDRAHFAARALSRARARRPRRGRVQAHRQGRRADASQGNDPQSGYGRLRRDFAHGVGGRRRRRAGRRFEAAEKALARHRGQRRQADGALPALQGHGAGRPRAARRAELGSVADRRRQSGGIRPCRRLSGTLPRRGKNAGAELSPQQHPAVRILRRRKGDRRAAGQ